MTGKWINVRIKPINVHNVNRCFLDYLKIPEQSDSKKLSFYRHKQQDELWELGSRHEMKQKECNLAKFHQFIQQRDSL